MKNITLNPPQIIILSFLSTILLGALLLNLPLATRDHTRPAVIDSLFTAASATCVTGLVVRDTGCFFSPFGKFVILVLIQIGGLGIMTLSTLFAILLGKRLTLSQNVIVQSALDHHETKGLTRLILQIVIFTIAVEFTGALILYMRWIGIMGHNCLLTLEHAVFHSVSAFCNAGFALFSDSLMRFRSDWVVMTTICGLIVIGGIGFVVFLDIPKLKLWRKDRRLILSHLSLQTKVVFLITAVLILAGALGVYLFEADNVLNGLPLKEKIWGSVFTSITPRTAGFEVLPTANLKPCTLFFIIILMIIGASPGGTGGGIKTVTLGIIIASFFSMFYNRDRIMLFGRTIQRVTYRKATAVVTLCLVLIFLSTFLLLITEYVSLKTNNYFLSILFESTSAFGTVGLSMGVTSQLTYIGKLVIICTMFAGRVGPLTLALAVALRKERVDYHYPEERLMVG